MVVFGLFSSVSNFDDRGNGQNRLGFFYGPYWSFYGPYWSVFGPFWSGFGHFPVIYGHFWYFPTNPQNLRFSEVFPIFRHHLAPAQRAAGGMLTAGGDSR